jgi:hypothetical protein
LAAICAVVCGCDAAAMRATYGRAIDEESRAALDEGLTISVASKAFRPPDEAAGRRRGELSITLEIRNGTAKDLASIKGVVSFKDLSDKPVKHAAVDIDCLAPAGHTVTCTDVLEYDSSQLRDIQLALTPIDRLRAIWLPEAYAFADGTSMSMVDFDDPAEHANGETW